jgi:cyclophilin family peptidyl-prolyl cis-trans isomerase
VLALRRAACALCLPALAALLAACGGGSSSGSRTAASEAHGCSTVEPAAASVTKPTFAKPPPMTIDRSARYRATMVTSCGTIVIALDAKAAPLTVNNFVFLARKGFYDGLTFHRVVKGFVIQGGDPAGDGTGGPGYEFRDELPSDGYPLGSVAMANSGPNTNGSQFFIVTGTASLPNDYSRFGRVVTGLAVARKIESLADPNGDEKPIQTVWIDSVTISGGT